jgi:hypothetical protein
MAALTLALTGPGSLSLERNAWPLVDWQIVEAGRHTSGYPSQHCAIRSKTRSSCEPQMISATIDLL